MLATRSSAVYLGLLLCAGLALQSVTARAQTTTQQAHEQGVGFGESENARVGTRGISTQTAKELPYFKNNPAQQQGYSGGFGDMLEIGTSRITESGIYSSGNCDKENFDPQAAARANVGDVKWALMSTEQKNRAITNQIAYFDQECDGINFLANDYDNRIEYVIQPEDDLAEWAPNPGTPDTESACTEQVFTTPDTTVMNYCHESAQVTRNSCATEATVRTWASGGNAVGYYELHYSTTGINEESHFRIIENGTFQCFGGGADGVSCSANGSTGTWTSNCSAADGAGSCVKGTSLYSASMQADGCTVSVTRTLPNGTSLASTNYNFCSPRAPGTIELQTSWGTGLGPMSTLYLDRVSAQFGQMCNPNNGCHRAASITLGDHSAAYVQTGGYGVQGSSQWTVVERSDGCWVDVTRVSSATRLWHNYWRYAAGVYGHFVESYTDVQIPAQETYQFNLCRPAQEYYIDWQDACLPYTNVQASGS